jgi:hypothetical protein
MRQIDKRLVDDRVGPVAVLVEQSAERILHRAGCGREDVRLHRWQVNDVLTDEALRNLKALGVNLVQAEEFLGQFADRVAHIDPGFAFLARFGIKVHVTQAMGFNHIDLLILLLTKAGVDHDGAVVAGVNQAGVVAVPLHGPDHTFELPGRGRAAGIEEVPGDVDLQRGIGVLGDFCLIISQVQQFMVIAQHGSRCRGQNGDF